ncbi:MAG: FAD-binding protein [Moorea sp. SIOASIH]|uniref:D-arabinono-1,4-lactone oxidase n=1 Tax=Moorena sp. SIOASIH TaxID=2607817 RepID=UPI0013B5FCA7|nr:D-arabinono-1,4-lactone oxidase [Moorena sp. SIOASIH]NEO41291.1 FAD-binding protein [Moorena sp. SIOASIH]
MIRQSQSNSTGKVWKSWNNRIKHSYETLCTPTNETELIEIIQNTSSVRVIGTGKSSADICAGTSTLISLEKYNEILKIDKEQMEITVQSGITLKSLLRAIDIEGWSLPALPDIDTISLGGALATGTHGTGREAHLLSYYITSCRLITADGTVINVTQGSPLMDATQVSLGLLGVISTVTIKCEPAFLLYIKEEPIEDNIWLSTWKKELSNNFFYRILWLPHTGYGYVIKGIKTESLNHNTSKKPWYIKHRRKVSALLYKYTVKYPFLTVLANKIIQRLFFNHVYLHLGRLYEETVTKSRGSTIELSEWIVPRDRFEACFLELKKTLNSHQNKSYAHIPMDIRFICRETAWLSYAYDCDIVTVGCVTRIPEHADSYSAFKTIEDVFKKYEGRPHWAKRHRMTASDFKKIYPKWEEFINLRRQMDPRGKFLNGYLQKIFA